MSTAKKEPGLAMLVIVLALICLVVAALLGLVNQVTCHRGQHREDHPGLPEGGPSRG